MTTTYALISGGITGLLIFWLVWVCNKAKWNEKEIEDLKKDMDDLRDVYKYYFNLKYYLMLETDILDNYKTYKDYSSLHTRAYNKACNECATKEKIKKQYKTFKEEL